MALVSSRWDLLIGPASFVAEREQQRRDIQATQPREDKLDDAGSSVELLR